MHRATPDSLKKTTILEQLSKPVRDCLLSKAYVRNYARGATIILHGDATNTLKVVESGWVKLYRVSPSGSEAILEVLRAEQSFDEIAALETGYSSASAETLSECRLLHIDLSAIHTCENAYKELSKLVLLAASEHLNEMSTQVEHLKVKTGAQRLSSFLIEQSDNNCAADKIELPYEKTVLAGKLGMKPESLSRAFNRLKSLGVSCDCRSVSINNVSRLREFSSEDPVNLRTVA